MYLPRQLVLHLAVVIPLVGLLAMSGCATSTRPSPNRSASTDAICNSSLISWATHSAVIVRGIGATPDATPVATIEGATTTPTCSFSEGAKHGIALEFHICLEAESCANAFDEIDKLLASEPGAILASQSAEGAKTFRRDTRHGIVTTTLSPLSDSLLSELGYSTRLAAFFVSQQTRN